MNEADEAQLTYWLEVLEEVVNGRSEGHSCPFCGASPLTVKVKGAGVRIDCSACGKYFDGRQP